MVERRTAIVTGASSGIGADCAAALAESGFRVCLMARRRERLEKLVEKIALDAGRDAAVAVSGDVTSPQDRKQVLERVIETWGRLNLLVNNAGYALSGTIEDLDCDAVRKEFEVNCFAYLAWMQEVIPVMISQPDNGRIINIGSASGLMASPGLGAYAASKYAVEAFSDAARRELRRFGVPVILVEPGSVRSEIWDNAESMVQTMGLDWEKSRYHDLYRMEFEFAERVRTAGPSSSVVARAVVRAATAPKPKPRYYVTGEARMAAVLSKMPARFQDWVLRRLFR